MISEIVQATIDTELDRASNMDELNRAYNNLVVQLKDVFDENYDDMMTYLKQEYNKRSN